MLNDSRNKRIIGRRYFFIVLCLIIFLCVILSFHVTAHADEGSNGYIDDFIGAIDEDSFSNLIDNDFGIFDDSDVFSTIKNVATGNFSFDYSDLLSFLMSLVGISISDLLSLLITIVAIGIIYSILDAVKSKNSGESVGKIVNFACITAVIVVVGKTTIDMFNACAKTLDATTNVINTIMPIALTIMSAVGGGKTASVFQPAVVVLTSGLFNLISNILLPMLIVGFSFGIVGNLSSELKLGKTAEFLSSSVKWLFGIGFFLLSAFLSVQGITASTLDGISVRSAKFTIGKFVPVIGGYLSEGFNLVISGGLLVKNALGYTTLLLLAITLLPIIVKVGIYTLTLRLASACVEPLGNKTISNLLTSVANTSALTGGIMTGTAFLSFIFILILISTGNVVL